MALTPAWRRARNLLAVRLDSMGDVLMTSPALAALKRGTPGGRLTLLTSAAGAEAARRIDAVDETLVYAAPWVGAATAPGDPQADRAFIDALAARRFDAAVIFTVCTQSALPAALACRLAGIPLRLAHARENPCALLTDWVPERDVRLATARHEVAIVPIGPVRVLIEQAVHSIDAHPHDIRFLAGDAGRLHETAAEELTV